jgi:cysteinyl-tRNA synthetase
MSKSLNNFVTINDFLKNYSAETLRLMINFNHYRSPLNYTEELAIQADNSLKNLRKTISALSLKRPDGPIGEEIKNLLEKTDLSFQEAMNEDINTPKALASIFELINSVEKNIWKLNKKEANAIKNFISKKMEIFIGIIIKPAKIPLNIAKIAQKRELYRENKQFIQSDLLRKKIEEVGYIIEDTPGGPLILKN